METKRSVPTKVLSLFLSVLMALSCFAVALPNLAPEAKAAGLDALGEAFGVALSTGYMSTSDFGGIDTSVAGKVVVIDSSEEGIIYNVVKALADVVAANTGKHNTVLADEIIAGLGLNQYQADFVRACLPADGDYAAFDGVNGTWNGDEADRAAQSKTFELGAARSVGAAVMTYDAPAAVPAEVETSVTLTVTAKLKVVASTNGSETGGVYVNDAAAVTTEKTALTADEQSQINALKAYLAYVNSDPFKTNYLRWYNNGNKNDSCLYSIDGETLENMANGFSGVYSAAAVAEQNWIEHFVGQGVMNDNYTFSNKCAAAKAPADLKKYVDWIMPTPSIPILDRNPDDSLKYNPRDNYSETDRDSLVVALRTGNALKGIMDAVPAATKTILVSELGYSLTAYAEYVDMIQGLIDKYDLQDMLRAHNWLTSNNANRTFSFTDEQSIFYDAASFVADHYALTTDTAVSASKTYYVPGTVYEPATDVTAENVTSYYTRSDAHYTACTSSTVFSSRETYYIYNEETREYTKVGSPVAANISTYYTLDDYTYTAAAAFAEGVIYYSAEAGYVVVKNPVDSALNTYYEHFNDSYAALKGIGDNEYVASAYGVFVLTEDVKAKDGKTYYTDASGATEIANTAAEPYTSICTYAQVSSPVEADVDKYYTYDSTTREYKKAGDFVSGTTYYTATPKAYEASGELCPITVADLQLIVNFYAKAVELLGRTNNGAGVIETQDAQDIRDIKAALDKELASRSVATTSYLAVYGWFVKKMAGAAIAGMPVGTLTALITEAEAKYGPATANNTLLKLYSSFSSRDTASGGVYAAANAKCRAYIDKMYVELYNRAYDYSYQLKTDWGSGLAVTNYYACSGDVINIDRTLITWVQANKTNIGNAAGRLGVSVNTGYILTIAQIDSYKSQVDAYNPSIPSPPTTSNLPKYTASGFTRYGGAYHDFARKRDDKNYAVSTANGGNLQKTVNNIDKFLSNDHFVQVLGADEQYGVSTLNAYIKQILCELVFTDDIINTIIGALFPLLTNLLDVTVKEDLLEQYNGGRISNISSDAGEWVDGNIFIFVDGSHSEHGQGLGSQYDPWLFPTFAEKLGLKVYPSTFTSYISGKGYSTQATQILAAAHSTRNWTNPNDEDAKLDLKSVKWGINDITDPAARYNKFCQVAGDVLGSCESILQAILGTGVLNKSLTSSKSSAFAYVWGTGLGSPKWYIPVSGESFLLYTNVQAIIGCNPNNNKVPQSGINLYERVWIPVMEALGLNGDLGSYTFASMGATPSGSTMVHCLFDPIYNGLIPAIAAKPLESILKILPNISYHLMNNSIQKLLNSLDINIWLRLYDVGQADGSGFVSTLNEWFDIIGAFEDKLQFGIDPINLGEKVNLNEMLETDLTDLNKLVEFILGKIVDTDENDNPVATLHAPAINSYKLAQCYTSISNTHGRSGNRTYLSASQSYQQVLYLLLDWLFDTVGLDSAYKSNGFIADILGFIADLNGDDPSELPEIIFTVLENIHSSDDVIAALVELFNPQTYTMDNFKWYNTGAAAGVGTLGLSLSDFCYLKYQNDWTQEKADYIYNNLDSIVNDVFNMIDPSLLAPYGGDAGKWLNVFINTMFNNEGIWNVVDLLTKIGFSLCENPNITKLIKQQLKGTNQQSYNTDLLVWFNDYGYRYADDPDYDEIFHLKTLDELGGQRSGFATGEFIKVLEGQAYVYQRNLVKDDEASTSGNPVYKTYNANDATTYTESKVRAYPNSYYYGKSGDHSYEGGGSHSTTKNLKFLSTYTLNSDNEKIYDWQVKLTSATAGFVDGVNANQWVTLVDGSDNARAVFTAMFVELIGPLAPVFNLILSGTGLMLFDAIEIRGYESYNAALVPVLEALGVKGLPTQAEYNNMGYEQGFNTLVNLLFQALTDLLTDERVFDGNGNWISGKGPFQKVIDVLPHLFYLFQSNGLSTIVKNLLMFAWTLVDTIRPLADINLDAAIHQALCALLGYCYDESAYPTDDLVTAILDLAGIKNQPYSAFKANKDREKVDAIFNLSLSDLSLETVYTVVEVLTGLDLTPLSYVFEAMCISNSDGANGGVKKMTRVTSASANNQKFVTSVFTQPRGINSGDSAHAYTLNFEGADVITVTISVLLDLLRYEGNAQVLDDLIGLTKDALPGGGQLLGDATATGFLEALEIIFTDKKHSADIQRPNWDYLFEGKNVKYAANGNQVAWVDITSAPGDESSDDATQWANLIAQCSSELDISKYRTINNLKYSTDWTEQVAGNIVNMLEQVLDYVASLVGYEGEGGFSGWVNSLLNEVAFNANTLAVVVNLLATVYDIVPPAVRGLIDELADVNMNGWEEMGLVVKYNAAGIETAYSEELKGTVDWTVVTYTEAEDYDEDEDYYKKVTDSDTNEEKYEKVTVSAEAFAEGTFYTKTVTEHSEPKYVVTTSGDFKYATKWDYGYADDQYAEVEGERKLIDGAVKTYHATDDVTIYKKNAAGDWQQVTLDDNNNATVKSSYTVNYNYKWFDPDNAAYIHDRATFIEALKEIVHTADALFGYIFLEDDFKVFYTNSGTMQHGQGGDDTDAIALNGVGLYNLLVVPVLEALGVPLTEARYNVLVGADAEKAAFYADAFSAAGTQNYGPSKYKDESATGHAKYKTHDWIDDMFVIFQDLFDDVLDNPVDWVLDTLPALIYFINAGGFTTCIANTFGVLQELLNAVNLLLDDDSQISMVISGIDLNNTSLSGLMGIVEQFIPGFHINDEIIGYCKSLYVGDLQCFDSANGYKSFTMYYSDAEQKKDMVTILVSLLIELLTDKGTFVDPNNNYLLSEYDNAAALAALIGEEYEDVVSEAVFALKNPTEVEYADLDWDYFDGTLNLADPESAASVGTAVTVPAYAFQYLNYTTSWKYDKAVTTVEGLNDLICAVLGLVDEEKFGDMTSIGEIINTETIYTAEIPQKLLTLLSDLLFGEDAKIPAALLEVVGAVLGADLSAWNYTYQFATELEDGKTVAGNENGLDYFTGTTYEDVYVAAAGEFDAEATYYTTKDIYTKHENVTAETFADDTYYTKAGQGDAAVYTLATAFDANVARYFTKETKYVEAENVTEDNYTDYLVVTQNATGTRKTYIVNDAESFASAIALVLQPAGRLLAWLLFDDSYEFFVGNVDSTKDDILLTIPGGAGYENGLVLLLEALGCKGLGYATKYTSGSVDNATGLRGNDLFLYDLAQSLVGRINEIIANPIDEIVGLIPELIYFINANGLGVVVSSLLAGPLALVGQVPSVVALIDEDINPEAITDTVNDLVKSLLNDAFAEKLDADGDGEVSEDEELGFSMDGVNLKWIMELVEVLTGLEITDILQNSLDRFFIGVVNSYASKSHKIAYKMSFDQTGFINGGNGDMGDFLTILLSFAIDLICYGDNSDVIAELANIDPALIDAIIALIHDGYTVDYNDYDWFYFDSTKALYDEDGNRITEDVVEDEITVTRPVSYNFDENTAVTVPYNTINYLTYASDWTEETAKYLVDNRNEIIEAVFGLLNLEGSVADAVKGVFDPETSIYTAETLNSILNVVKPLITGLPSVLVDVLGIILDIDLTPFTENDGYYSTNYNEVEIEEFADGVTYYTADEVEEGEVQTYTEVTGEFDAETTYYVYKEINFTDGDRSDFVNGLTEMLQPLYGILDWLLFGKPIQYFDKLTYSVYEASAFASGTVYYEKNADGTFFRTNDTEPKTGKTYYTLVKDEDSTIEILININGAEGYKYGLVPLLEALGVTLPELNDGDGCSEVLFTAVNNVLARLEAILANPVDEVLNLLPELLYFINSNALAIAVHNLLAGVFGLVEDLADTGLLNDVLDIEEGESVDINGIVNSLIGDLGIDININKLDLVAILEMVESLTGTSYVEYNLTADTALDDAKTYYAKIVTPAEEEGGEDKVEYKAVKAEDLDAAAIATYYEKSETEFDGIDLVGFFTKAKIDNFYFGDMVGYQSANGQIAFKMVFDAEQDMADLLTIIVNLAIDVLMDEENAAAIDRLISGVADEEGTPEKNTVGAVVAILLGLRGLDDVEPEAIDWDYFLGEGVELASTGVTVPAAQFIYLDYNNLWTRDLATGLGADLTNLINQVLALNTEEGEEPETLEDLVAGLVDLDSVLNANILNTILDTVAPLLYGEDSILATELLNVIGLVLGADLTQWNNTYRFETALEGETYTEESATALKYREGTLTWYDKADVDAETFANGEYYTADEVEEGAEQTYTLATAYADETTYYAEKTFTGKIYAIDGTEDFASGLTVILQPVQKLLGWLLLGNDYRFFVPHTTGNVDNGERQDDELLVIPGFNGYDLSLTLLLEALGCTGLKKGSEYAGNEAEMLKDIINALVGRVEDILADPVNNVLDLIPELIYFINAGGLNAVVMNLVGGLLEVVEYVNDSGLLEEDIAINGYTLDRNVIDVLVDGILNDALKDILDKNEDGELSDAEKVDFALADINIDWIIDLAETLTGFDIQNAIGSTYDLSKFVLGGVERYDSASTAYDVDGVSRTYRVQSSADTRGDVITILISLVLDVLEYKNDATQSDNAAVLAGMLTGVADGKITIDVIDTAINILKGWDDAVTYETPDWFYCVTSPATYTEDITAATDVTLNDRTINYLSYKSDWTEETAKYLVNNIDEIIAEVLTLTGSEDTSLADIINGAFSLQSDLYTADNLNKIAGLVKDLSDKLGDALVSIVGMILGIDLAAYDDMEFTVEEINSKETFIAGLVQVLKPVYALLDWFLFGKDLAFFYDNDFYNGGAEHRDLIHITGGDGYNYALVPLFEALGITLPAGQTAMNDAALEEVLTNVLNRVEGIIANPVDEVLALLPNLIYFINANGISVVVSNLLASIFALVDVAAPVIIEFVGDEIALSEDIAIKFTDTNNNILPTYEILNNIINGLLADNDIDVEVDYRAIDILKAVEIVESLTGLRIVDVVTENKIDKFFIGDIEYFESANGKPAFRMSYSTKEEAHDMLTIVLNLIVEVLLYEDGSFRNRDVLYELVDIDGDTQDIIDTVIELLTNPSDYEFVYAELNWNYFDGDAVLGSTIAVPKSQFIYLAYQNDWTFDRAQYLDANLEALVDSVLKLVKDDDTATLAGMLGDAVNPVLDEDVFNAENLNTIYNLLNDYLYGEHAVVGEAILDVAGLLIEGDLRVYDGSFSFENATSDYTYTLDAEKNLKFRRDGGSTIYAIGGREDFINALCMMLKPADKLLSFIFLGDSFGFFVDNATGDNVLLTIPGAEGYRGLALLLEALGCKDLQSGYENATEMLQAVLTSIVNRVAEILSNPIDEVLNLVTELIYFINANGLSVAVQNMLAAAFNILDASGIIYGAGKEYTTREAWVNALVNDALGDTLGGVEFDINGINIQWVIDVVEAILAGKDMPFQINAVLANSIRGVDYQLQTLAIGKAQQYNSVSGLGKTYKMVYGNGSEEGGASRADMITILLSFVIDFIRNADNQAVLAGLLGDTLGADGAKTVADFLEVLTEHAYDIEPDVDWFYFDPGYTYTTQDALNELVPSIAYLTYASDWTEQLADYLDDNLTDLVAEILDLAGVEGTAADAIKGVFDPAETIYTADILNDIATTVKDLVDGLDEDLKAIIAPAADLILDIDIHAYDEMTFDAAVVNGNMNEFVLGLTQVLEPIYPVLDWLLFSDALALFNRSTAADNIEDLVVLGGYDGYAYGLVPLLEALGCVLPDCSDKTSANYNCRGMLNDVLTAVLARMEQILGDPVEEVLALIPNLLYFINANGLASAVNNLLGAVLGLVDYLKPVLGDLDLSFDVNGYTIDEDLDINTLLNVLLADKLNGYELTVAGADADLDLTTVLEIVEVFTGLDLLGFIRDSETAPLTETALEEFYVGQITYFESSNGQPAFKMTYADSDSKSRADLITIVVNFLLEAVTYGGNAAVIDEMIGSDIVETVLAALDELATSPVPGNFHWNYFNEASDDVTPEADYAAITLPATPFNNHLTYASDWTQEVANNLYDNAAVIADGILAMIAADDDEKAASVAELLIDALDGKLYTAANLNKLLELTEKAYDALGVKTLGLVGLVLSNGEKSSDITAWNRAPFTDAEIYDSDTFIAGLIELLEPISGVLDWLLFADGYNFFVTDKVNTETGKQDTILNIAGSYGYLYGLAPILLALGVDLPSYSKSTDNCATMLEPVLKAVAARIDEILADPVNEVLDLLPELLYFINANGVSTAVYNLAGGVINAVNVLVDNDVLDLGADTIEDYVETQLGLNTKNLDLEGIFAFLEAKDIVRGLKLNEVFEGTYTVDGDAVTFTPGAGQTNILEKFYVGEVVKETYSDINYWVMKNTAAGRGDILTMLLSIVLDVLFYDGNEDAAANLIAGLLNKDDFTTENFVALKGLLMAGATDAKLSDLFLNANWVYYLGLTGEQLTAQIEAVLSADETALPALPQRTLHYLEYDNNWNLATADYLNANIVDIVDLVINMIDSDYLDLEDFIAGKLDIYTDDTANWLVDKIAGLVGKLDGMLGAEVSDKVLTTAGSLLGVDVQAVCTPVSGVHDKATLVAALADRLGNLDTVLDWLLFGRDYKLFTKLTNGESSLITLAGGNGWKHGLAPLLQAIGVDTHIEAEVAAAEANVTAGTFDTVTEQVLGTILTKVCDRIDELLYGGNERRTIDEVFALLPELIYFINAGAASKCVMNLLAPADALLATVEAETGVLDGKTSVNDLITAVDLANIDFDFIFDLVLSKTGINMAAPAGEYIKTFYLGKLESYKSYDNYGGVRMVYSDDTNKIDMLTILVTLVLDVLTYEEGGEFINRQAVVDLIGSDNAGTIVDTILALLTDGVVDNVAYQQFDWQMTEYAGTGIVVSPVTLGETLYTSVYGPLYTRAMGEYMSKYLTLLINTYITLLGVNINGFSLSNINDLITSLIGGSLYRTEYLVKINDLIVGLVNNLKDTLGDELYGHIAEVLNRSLGVDLGYWDTYTVPNIADDDREGFITAICDMLTPAEPLLEWLLTGKDIALFNKNEGSDVTGKGDDSNSGNDYLLLPGAEGYRYGIVPLLEALNNGNKTGIKTQAQYEAAINNAVETETKTQQEAKAEVMFGQILNPIADLIDRVLDDPVNGVLNLLPELVYFMNSNGLDTCVKNLLHAVYVLLAAIDPIIEDVDKLHQDDGTVDLLALAGIDLRNYKIVDGTATTEGAINLNSLLNELNDGRGLVITIGDAELDLNDTVVDLAKELALGYVNSYESNINAGDEYFQDMYAMTYTDEQAGANGLVGDKTDIVTLVLRLLLKFVSDNPEFIKNLLRDKLSGDGYNFLCSLIDNFAQMSSTQDGMDKIMYTVYYVFYAALVGGVATNNGLATFNGNYSFLHQLFATSDVKFIKQISDSFDALLHIGETTDPTTGEDNNDGPFSPIIDETGVIPNGQISFWQKIINFFKKIADFFKNMFK